MAFHIGGDPDEDAIGEINVTPLVDVMLVLLIIFMITAPMLHQGVEVTLPKTVASEDLPLRIADPLVLTVKTDGLVYIRSEPVHPSKLVERLGSLLEAREDQQVFLKGDREISYGTFIEVVDLLHQGGIRHVGLVTDRIAGDEDGARRR
jgi:biopolymer transport protein TolR